MKTINMLWILIAFVVLFSGVVLADSHLPEGLLKAQEYNQELAQDFLKNVSIAIAFLAGVTSILSPCILPLLPAYFAITFEEKKRITLATFLFFVGFTSVFVAMGLLATLTGKTLVTVFKSIDWLVPVAGGILLLFGIMILLGKGFPGLQVASKRKKGWWGIVATGALFGVGWTACIGPILSGVLLMTATFSNYGTTSLLMVSYSLGIFVPLFILSFFYDKLRIDKIKWLHAVKKITIGNRVFTTNIPNIIAGSLFLILGAVFIIFRGTWIVNGLQMFGLRQYFYSFQNYFIDNIAIANVIGIVLLVTFIIALAYVLIKDIKKNK